MQLLPAGWMHAGGTLARISQPSHRKRTQAVDMDDIAVDSERVSRKTTAANSTRPKRQPMSDTAQNHEDKLRAFPGPGRDRRSRATNKAEMLIAVSEESNHATSATNGTLGRRVNSASRRDTFHTSIRHSLANLNRENSSLIFTALNTVVRSPVVRRDSLCIVTRKPAKESVIHQVGEAVTTCQRVKQSERQDEVVICRSAFSRRPSFGDAKLRRSGRQRGYHTPQVPRPRIFPGTDRFQLCGLQVRTMRPVALT